MVMIIIIIIIDLYCFIFLCRFFGFFLGFSALNSIQFFNLQLPSWIFLLPTPVQHFCLCFCSNQPLKSLLFWFDKVCISNRDLFAVNKSLQIRH